MRCNYPNCRSDALYTPVVELPTIRTRGVIKPLLSNLVHDPLALRRAGFNRNQMIRQYEESIRTFAADENERVYTDRPTMLLCKEVCRVHKESYNLFNWIRRSEIHAIREAARHYGVEIQADNMIVIKFQPIGWRVSNGRLEMVRDRMAKD